MGDLEEKNIAQGEKNVEIIAPEIKPAEKTAPERKLTLRERKFVNDYIKTGNQAEAVRRNYNVRSDNVARSMGAEIMQRPIVANRIQQICAERGLTEDWAVKILKAQGAATRPLVVSKGDVRDVADNASRLEAAKTALKLHGHLRDGANNIDVDARSVQIGAVDRDTAGQIRQASNALAELAARMRALDGVGEV